MADKKGGKKPASPDDIMSAKDLRPILAQAKRGNAPSCAIAMSRDKEGVILVDKRAKPKKMMTELKKQAGAAGLELETTSIRFGRAMVDSDVDAALLTIVVNKDAPGALRAKLLDQIKKAGFSKLEIIVDAGLELEPEEDGDAGAPSPGQPGAAAAAPTSDSSAAAAPALDSSIAAAPTLDLSAAPPPDIAAPVSAAPDAIVAPPPEAPAAPPPPEPQAAGPAAAPAPAGAEDAALTKELADLVRRMIPLVAADPAGGDALKALAKRARADLAAADPQVARNSIAALRQAIDQAAAVGAAAPSAAPKTPAPSPAIAKARLAWVATRKKVDNDLGQLHAAFTDAFKGHGKQDDLTKAFRTRVDTVLDTLDEALAHKLDAVNSATDAAEHATLVREAKGLIDGYSKHVAGDPTIAELDRNPFVPLSIQKTMTATLTALSRAIG